MPIPKPISGESENEFLKRIMADETMNREYPQQAQRAAIAYNTWRHHQSYAVMPDPLAPKPVQMPYPYHPRDHGGNKKRLEDGDEVSPGYAIDADEGLSQSSSP